ncbi:MAG: zf-HC2 domain-containing protein [Lachnospiraceae bacterium]|nr:zf-HC2 domain-containing protein [Lachnospiraceae bacterium]
MRNDCNIIRDILPLYTEGMVSEDTAAFVQEHLATCPQCKAEWEAMKQSTGIQWGRDIVYEKREETTEPYPMKKEKAAVDIGDEAIPLRTLKKKMKKRTRRTVLVTVLIMGVLLGLLYHFPVWRAAAVQPFSGYYDSEEVSMLLYIGDPWDRIQAQSVLWQAEEAFCDISHTWEENRERYGLLSRYAFAADSYGAVDETHSLKLWSAHFEDSEGYLWVYYSQEALDADGEVIAGSWRIPSLWRVEKDADGKWIVVDIDEHP